MKSSDNNAGKTLPADMPDEVPRRSVSMSRQREEENVPATSVATSSHASLPAARLSAAIGEDGERQPEMLHFDDTKGMESGADAAYHDIESPSEPLVLPGAFREGGDGDLEDDTLGTNATVGNRAEEDHLVPHAELVVPTAPVPVVTAAPLSAAPNTEGSGVSGCKGNQKLLIVTVAVVIMVVALITAAAITLGVVFGGGSGSDSSSPPTMDWLQLGQDLDGDAAGDRSGVSVSLSANGTVLAVGAHQVNNNGTGYVRIYELRGFVWLPLGDIMGEAPGDLFGVRVSLSGDGRRVAASGYKNDEAGRQAGHVRVLEFDGSSWVQLGLDLDGEALNNYFGYSLSLSGDGTVVAVGAPYALDENGSFTRSGVVRVFQFSGTNWNQHGQVLLGEASELLGYSISLSTDGFRLAVGANQNSGNGVDSGLVRVYEFDGSMWRPLGQDLNGLAAGDQLGSDVALSGDGSTVAVGSIEKQHVLIYRYSRSKWTQLGQRLDRMVVSNSPHGRVPVALSHNGDIVAVGNDGADVVQMYELSGTTWVPLGSTIEGEAGGDLFGFSVALSSEGDTVAIGVFANSGNGFAAGRARVYGLQPV